MFGIGFEILLIFVLLLVNGLFSMSELAVVSARKIRLQKRADAGDAGAQTALQLAAAPDRFLSTVQIGITLVGVLAGAFGGAGAARYLAELLKTVEFLAPFADSISFVLVVALITYLSVVVGELIPKSIALNYPEAIAAVVSRPMQLVSTIAAPVVWLLSAPTGFVLRLFKVHAVVEPPVTDDEIKGLIAQGTEAGVFEETEQNLLESVIHLDDKRITALMTTRLEIAWLDLESPITAIRETINKNPFSRFPVARGSLDQALGYVALKDLLKQQINHDELNLENALKQPLFVPETVTALELLEKFKVSDTHLALVIDEHGAIEGLITITDVLEAIVGETVAGKNGAIKFLNVEQRPDGTFLLDGRMLVQEFKEALGIEKLPDAAGGTGHYETLAGFVLTELGKIPQVGDRFRSHGYLFEVIEMQRNRIAKVAAQPLEVQAQTG